MIGQSETIRTPVENGWDRFQRTVIATVEVVGFWRRLWRRMHHKPLMEERPFIFSVYLKDAPDGTEIGWDGHGFFIPGMDDTRVRWAQVEEAYRP
jgi:hypothetical protein